MAAQSSHRSRLIASLLITGAAVLASGCSPSTTPSVPQSGLTAQSRGDAPAPAAQQGNIGDIRAIPVTNAPFTVTTMARFRSPWAIAFVPDTPFAIITERGGTMKLWQADGPVRPISGVPRVAVGGQGGLGDVIVLGGANEAGRVRIAFSWVMASTAGYGAVVSVAELDPAAELPQLENQRTIWQQVPFHSGRGHFGHRLTLAPDGAHLFISSGERQAFDPAQDMGSNLGKIIRLRLDGMRASVPADNPFAGQGGVAEQVTGQIWSLGHRNPLGMAFDDGGRLWVVEMGPAGGDELNLIERGGNYGYPRVSNGDHYDGRTIPDHAPGDGFIAPALWWSPVISPGGMMIYRGNAFPQWRGDAFITALSGEGLVRVDLDGGAARSGDRWAMGTRIRAVAEGPDGAIWLLEDGDAPRGGRLMRLSPRR